MDRPATAENPGPDLTQDIEDIPSAELPDEPLSLLLGDADEEGLDEAISAGFYF